MSPPPVSVSIVPRDTLEAESLALVLRGAGVVVEAPEAEATLLVVALPRASQRRLEDMPEATLYTDLLLVAETDDARTAALAKALCATDVVSWRRPVAEVLSLVRSMAQGASAAAEGATHGQDPFASLTTLERDVIELVIRGRTDDQVASSLKISPTSVRGLVQRALSTLRVRHRQAAATLARSSPVMRARAGRLPDQRTGRAAS